jgi:hypothetical protein
MPRGFEAKAMHHKMKDLAVPDERSAARQNDSVQELLGGGFRDDEVLLWFDRSQQMSVPHARTELSTMFYGRARKKYPYSDVKLYAHVAAVPPVAGRLPPLPQHCGSVRICYNSAAIWGATAATLWAHRGLKCPRGDTFRQHMLMMPPYRRSDMSVC